MKLKFGILWFEDQKDDIQPGITRVEREIKKHGFEPNIDFYPNLEGLQDLANVQTGWHAYELVVVDYNLEGIQGDEVAKVIRSHFPFTRILFYSSETKQHLIQIMVEAGVEGVFCEQRDALTDILLNFVEDLVAGVNRLESMRGLAASTIGRCDEMLRDSLKMLGQWDESEARAICQKIDEKVCAGISSNKNMLERCKNLTDRLNSRCVTSAHLYMVVSSRLKKLKIAKAQREKLVKYDKEALEPRNALSHAAEIEGTGGNWEIHCSSGNTLSTEDFSVIRSNLLAHLQNLKDINFIISSHVQQQTPDN